MLDQLEQRDSINESRSYVPSQRQLQRVGRYEENTSEESGELRENYDELFLVLENQKQLQAQVDLSRSTRNNSFIFDRAYSALDRCS